MEQHLEHIIKLRDQFYSIFVLDELPQSQSNNNSNVVSEYKSSSNDLCLNYKEEYYEPDDNLLTPITD